MSTETIASSDSRVCRWWMIHTFDNPVRRLFHKPEVILRGIVHSGDRCLDLGCGYGYFSVPMAGIAGPEGSVTAADLQPEMLAGVKRRAEKYGVSHLITLHRVEPAGLNLKETFDIALAFWMIHEVPDPRATLGQIAAALKPGGGRFLLVEPKGHVTRSEFARTVDIAKTVGFTSIAEPAVAFSRAVLFTRE